MGKFEELKSMKENGKILNWEKITREDLTELFKDYHTDSEIADLYDVTIGKVRYKRNKWNITISNLAIAELEKSDVFKSLNEDSKNRLLDRKNMNILCRAITHFIFRNGPIEDMHGDGKFSQKDMKTLNKYMMDHIASLLLCIYNNDFIKLEMLLAFYGVNGSNWDPAEPCLDELNLIYEDNLKNGGGIFPTKLGE